MKFIFFIIIVAVIALATITVQALWFSNQPIATVLYSCNAGKTIIAQYFQGKSKPALSLDLPPTPGGSVSLALSDGRSMKLAQTLSADGTRYASADESFVFWSKSDGALVLENNQEKSYIGCIMIAPEPVGMSLPQIYSNSSDGFSIRLPSGYAADEAYRYKGLGLGKDIVGVRFIIPASMATGTNLGADTYLSVEEIPQVIPPISTCTASLFLTGGVTARTVVDGNTTYSVASSTGAAAGNRYEETVYALPDTSASRRTCVAVRYFIHYGVIENYPAGAVREFNKQTLLAQFDAIRRTLVIVQ